MFKGQVAVVKIDTMMRAGTIGDLIERYTTLGTIDIGEDICELDIVVGSVIIDDFGMYGSHICGTEAIFNKMRIKLYEQGVRQEDVHDTKSILKYIGGGLGYTRCYNILKNMQDFEQGFMASWLCVFNKIYIEEVHELQIGVCIEDKDVMNIKVADVIDSYILQNKGVSNIHHPKIFLIPNYYWIQKVMKER